MPEAGDSGMRAAIGLSDMPRPLVIGIGNASRGDDALGPQLIDVLASEGCSAELMSVYQLQPEHALDLAGRPAVLIVDAARPGTLAGAAADSSGVTLQRLVARHDHSWSSHAVSPQALLQLCIELNTQVPLMVPPVWLLAVEGQCFDLGAALSAAASERLALALRLTRLWCVDPAAAQCQRAVVASAAGSGSSSA